MLQFQSIYSSTLNFILWWPAYFKDTSLETQFNEFIEFDERIMEKLDYWAANEQHIILN